VKAREQHRMTIRENVMAVLRGEKPERNQPAESLDAGASRQRPTGFRGAEIHLQEHDLPAELRSL
jgi:hypothetical protein